MSLETLLEKSDAFASEFRFQIDLIPTPYREIYLINNLNFDVANGGFTQWLRNICGRYSTETITALEVVGAKRTADILQAAIAALPNGNLPKDDQERNNMIDLIERKFADEWRKVGDVISEWPDDIDSLLRAFVVPFDQTSESSETKDSI